MQYKVIKNYNEYIEFCKSLYSQPVLTEDIRLIPYFNNLDKWIEFFNVKLPFNIDEDEYVVDLDILQYNIQFKPNENEYPIILIYSFDRVTNFRQGDFDESYTWHWKSLNVLGLEIISKQKGDCFYYSIQDNLDLNKATFFQSKWFIDYNEFYESLNRELILYNAFCNTNKPIINIKKYITWDDLNQIEKDNLTIKINKNFNKLNSEYGLPLDERIYTREELKLEFNKLINS